MVRMHFPRSLRRGELARARSTTSSDLPQPGDLCYFLQSLSLLVLQVAESWTCGDGLGHFGPAMLVAIENGKDGGVGANAFLSLKGQLAKCGLEHVRKASSLEQISFGAWEEAVKDVLFQISMEPPAENTEPELVDENFAELPVPVQLWTWCWTYAAACTQ